MREPALRPLPSPDPASGCPYCGRLSATGPGAFGTCGDFPCLYRRFCGWNPPGGARYLRPLPWNDPAEVRRIAVLRPGQLGDLLLAIPGLRALRLGFPNAEITLIAQPWTADLFGRLPWIDRILPLQERLSVWDPHQEEGSFGSFLQEARSQRYDLVLQLQSDAASYARFALALEARATAGFCGEELLGRSFHLLLSMSPTEPEVLRALRLLHALGVPPAGVNLEFPLLKEDLEELETVPGLRKLLVHRQKGYERHCHAERSEASPRGEGRSFAVAQDDRPLAQDDRPLAQDDSPIARDDSYQDPWGEGPGRRPVMALHVGARAPARRWPTERFAELARLLYRRYGAGLIMVGGPEEFHLAQRVIEEAGVDALNVAGKLSLGGLAALLARADLFVGNDSGPAQLAAAVAPRSLRIFGPANLHRWAPLDQARHRVVHRPVECSPCDHWECPIDHRCLKGVAVVDVMGEVEALLPAGYKRAGSRASGP